MNQELLKQSLSTPQLKEAWRFFDFNRLSNIQASSKMYQLSYAAKDIALKKIDENIILNQGPWDLLLKNANTYEAQIDCQGQNLIETLPIKENFNLKINFKSSGSYSLILNGIDNRQEITSGLLNFIFEDHTKVEINLVLINFSQQFFLKMMSSIKHQEIKLNFINLNSSFVRFEPHLNLLSEDSKLEFHGLNKLKSNEYCDIFSNINHFASHSASKQIQKNIVDDYAKVIFTGNIFIEKDLFEVDSAQLSRNILLSETSQALSRPQLEIYSFDVKCAHGSSTGQLNDDEFFYFSSRGIKPSTAKKLLLKAQANEIFFKIDNKDLQNQLLKWVDV